MKQNKTIAVVPYVEIDRYAGVWYEIGRYPHWYERGAYNVSAEYILRNDYLEIINRCKRAKKEHQVKGKAFIVPDSGNAKLKVQFQWPFKGDYWIIDLDEDYQWAVVSNPSQTNLWILYRKPTICNEELRSIVYRLVNRGFELAKVHWTKQTDKTRK
ncbi:lipocalin family protein [uncultured Bacteroides sp.]|uniref:lipocalin family protein n=1 Tax=uncultured Bacteroides sp. TaxID=162156 RepID=UPI002AABE371|nr:lipocalin family protein [uncultured Bacteroides sp.]